MDLSISASESAIASLNDTFDTKLALTALYFWILFGYMNSMVSCDLQRWMVQSPLFRHCIGVISFFFLFTLFDKKNDQQPWIGLLKTLFIYCVFLLMTKSKWYFALPIFLILVVDQFLAAQVAYFKKNEPQRDTAVYTRIRDALTIALFTLILVGFIAYVIRHRHEHGDEFEWVTLLFTNECDL
jgi:hypothetical protein